MVRVPMEVQTMILSFAFGRTTGRILVGNWKRFKTASNLIFKNKL